MIEKEKHTCGLQQIEQFKKLLRNTLKHNLLENNLL
jgi:hypothetical protein